MNKKQILSGILAGLITINTLGGCTSKTNSSTSSNSCIDTSIEKVEDKIYNYSINQYPKYMVREIYNPSKKLINNKKYSHVVEINGKYYSVLELENNTYKTIANTEFAKEIIANYINAINTPTEEVEMQGYKITSMDLSNFFNDKGELLYFLPTGYYVEQDKIIYKVEANKVVITNAASYYQEDGKVIYYAPNGGVVSAPKVIYYAPNAGVVSGPKVITKTYELVEKSLAQEIINSYLNNEDFNLQAFLDTKYFISTITASKSVENGETIYKVPDGYLLIGTQGYKVEEVSKYYADKKTLDTGEIVYFATHGGYISGQFEIVKTPVEDKELAMEIIDNYLENNNTLKLTK